MTVLSPGVTTASVTAGDQIPVYTPYQPYLDRRLHQMGVLAHLYYGIYNPNLGLP